ncbi:hypothetical protein RQP46_002224 [Phenoliferia psychrophenolica]
MSSLTPMQQAIFMNHQISIQTYLTQLSTAISLLPLSVDTGSIPLLGADAFVALEANLLHRESWAHVLPLLETVWGRPGAVSPGHITKGLQGIEVVSQLFGHVGAATLAGLEDEERDGAIGWILSKPTRAPNHRKLSNLAGWPNISFAGILRPAET